jgi:protein-tyrosine phosphatase
MTDDNDPTRIPLEFDPLAQHLTGYTGHKNLYIDVPFISHIQGNLYQGGCAPGMILPPNIVNVVSLYPWERYTVEHQLHSFLEVRMHDSLTQDLEQVDTIAGWVNARLDDGPTLVHCQAGINRSSLVTARALMLQGMPASDAIDLLRERRSPACLCNSTFEEWLRAV